MPGILTCFDSGDIGLFGRLDRLAPKVPKYYAERIESGWDGARALDVIKDGYNTFTNYYPTAIKTHKKLEKALHDAQDVKKFVKLQDDPVLSQKLKKVLRSLRDLEAPAKTLQDNFERSTKKYYLAKSAIAQLVGEPLPALGFAKVNGYTVPTLVPIVAAATRTPAPIPSPELDIIASVNTKPMYMQGTHTILSSDPYPHLTDMEEYYHDLNLFEQPIWKKLNKSLKKYHTMASSETPTDKEPNPTNTDDVEEEIKEEEAIVAEEEIDKGVGIENTLRPDEKKTIENQRVDPVKVEIEKKKAAENGTGTDLLGGAGGMKDSNPFGDPDKGTHAKKGKSSKSNKSDKKDMFKNASILASDTAEEETKLASAASAKKIPFVGTCQAHQWF